MGERVFLTGGSGFVGSAIVVELLSRGHTINALTRTKPIADAPGIQTFKGSVNDPASLDAAMQGCTAIIHLAGIILENRGKGVTFEKVHVEGTRNVVDAAKRAGISRYVQMSSLGTRANAVSDYHKSKWQAEEYVRGSGLDWTVIRPSLIHGPKGEFMMQAAKWARKQAAPYYFMPYFGKGFLGRGGAGLLQPMYVNDVARAFVDALENSKTIHKTYDAGGVERLTWPQLLDRIAKAAVGDSRPIVPIPVWYAILLTTIVPGSMLPFNRSQVVMSQEENTCDPVEFEHDFGWRPRGFSSVLAEYKSQL